MTEELEYYWVDVPKLFANGDNIPSWWENFETHCIEIYDRTMWPDQRKWILDLHSIMNTELKRFGGKYKHRNTRSSFRFNDESGFTLFLLRWT